MQQKHFIIKKTAALILVASMTLSFTSCGRSNAVTPVSENTVASTQTPSGTAKANNVDSIQRIERDLDTNLKVNAEVTMPATEVCSEYPLKFKSFTSDELSTLLLKNDTSKKTVSVLEFDPEGFRLNTENGAEIIAQTGGVSFLAESRRTDEIVNLMDRYRLKYPDGPEMSAELSFMSREDATKKGVDIIQQLDIACTPKAECVVALTNKQLSDWQETALQDDFNKALVDAGKTAVVKDWSDADDGYYITYSFVQDDIPLFNFDEPNIKLANDSGFPGTIFAEMLITSNGIRYFRIDGAVSFDGQSSSQKIISVDDALDKLKDKYSQVILTEPYTVTKIYLEYISIPEKDKKYLEAKQTLTPYWCFIIEIPVDDKGHTDKIAERFNAFTGADLTYGG